MVVNTRERMVPGRPVPVAGLGKSPRQSPPSSDSNRPWFSWWRGKRTRQPESVAGKSSASAKRKNSPLSAPGIENCVWERIRPTSKPALQCAAEQDCLLGVSTAPVSSCSASTVSRPTSWSDTASRNSPRESVVVFGPAFRPDDGGGQVEGEEVERAEHLTVEEPSAAAAKPIDIPYSRDDEINTVAHEAARQSMGEMDARMSLYWKSGGKWSRPRSPVTPTRTRKAPQATAFQDRSVSLPVSRRRNQGDNDQSPRFLSGELSAFEVAPSPSACSGYDGWCGDSVSEVDVHELGEASPGSAIIRTVDDDDCNDLLFDLDT